MESIIKNLEELIENMGLTVLEKWYDGFAYAIAIQHEKGVFVAYTTKGILHYDSECVLRMLQVTEHLPFSSVEPWSGGDFIMPYTYTLLGSGKCFALYNTRFRVEDFPHFLECAAHT